MIEAHLRSVAVTRGRRLTPGAVLLALGVLLFVAPHAALAGDKSVTLVDGVAGIGTSSAIKVNFADPAATLALQATYAAGATVTLESSVPPGTAWQSAVQTWSASDKILTAPVIGQLLYRINVTANPGTVALTTGAGLDDLTVTGDYTGRTATTWTVEVDATGTPDTIKWRKGAGTWTTGVEMTGSAQVLANGRSVTFGATTGHTLGDAWTITEHNVTVSVCVSGQAAEMEPVP